jgi:hypothetical protein
MDRVGEMAATARLVVQMTPEEKKALDSMAKRAGIPISEFVRRRLNADDLEPQRVEIEALLAGIEASAPEILAAVDHAIETVEAASASLDAMRAKP